MRTLKRFQGFQRQRQLVEVAHQTLDARDNKLFGRTAGAVAKGQAGYVVQAPGAPSPLEGLSPGVPTALEFEQPIEQLEQYELLARDHDIGTLAAIGTEAEEIPRLVNGLGAAGQDQRPMRSQRPGILDQPVALAL